MLLQWPASIIYLSTLTPEKVVKEEREEFGDGSKPQV